VWLMWCGVYGWLCGVTSSVSVCEYSSRNSYSVCTRTVQEFLLQSRMGNI